MISREKKAVLHVAKQQAGFDDETYREFLAAHAGGVRSSNDLTEDGFDAVMRAFKKKTHFKSTSQRRRRPPYQPQAVITPEQQQLLQELYAQLGWSDVTRQMGFSKRCCRRSFPQTRADANKVIEGLKAMIARGARSNADVVQQQEVTHEADEG